MPFKVLAALAALSLSPASAFAAQANSVSSNQGVNNNNAFSSTYSFGPGISCPTPSFAVSTTTAGGDGWGGGYSSGSSSYGASVSYIHPIGGDVGAACKELVQGITRQRQLDTDVNMIKVCANLAQSGITVDVKEFPEFAVCSAVVANGRTAVTTGAVFSPVENTLTVIPVRKN